jgi:hypothetical protein
MLTTPARPGCYRLWRQRAFGPVKSEPEQFLMRLLKAVKVGAIAASPFFQSA